jgi:hypothetical protein
MGAVHVGLVGYRADNAFDGERRLPDGALVLVSGERIVGVESGAAPAPADTPVRRQRSARPRAIARAGSRPNRGDHDTALTGQLAAGVTAVRDLGDMQWAVVERRHTPRGPAMDRRVGTTDHLTGRSLLEHGRRGLGPPSGAPTWSR